jgi:hypothetical protein
MAAGFLEHVIGKEATKQMLAFVEMSPNGADDDEYAQYHGLV